MRPHALVGPVALLTFASVAAPPVIASGGGAPGPTFSGGARYRSGAPRPAVQPVASRLTASPRSVVAGQAPPRLRFRVRQRGIAHVQARIVVLRLPRHAPVARMSLGWVQTGRQVVARWPVGVVLRAGHYLVQLHVKDSRGHTLRRSARNPGRTRILVRGLHVPPPVVVAPPPVVGPPPVAAPPPPSAALPAPVASPGGPGVFPVAGAFDFDGPGGRFGAGRPGHVHQGQDILAAAGTPVVAPYGGTVTSTSFQAQGAGEYVVLAAVDGRSYFFAHCIRGSTAVAEHAVIAAGQQVCQVGSTGTVSGSHLHFEIWNVGWRVAGGFPIDPLPELRAWARH
jgi:murein DD-endopeptidase MepM/ murein hydrolase activator NlpD